MLHRLCICAYCATYFPIPHSPQDTLRDLFMYNNALCVLVFMYSVTIILPSCDVQQNMHTLDNKYDRYRCKWYNTCNFGAMIWPAVLSIKMQCVANNLGNEEVNIHNKYIYIYIYFLRYFIELRSNGLYEAKCLTHNAVHRKLLQTNNLS